MSRLIDADELEKVMTEDWFLENLAAQDSKSAVKKDIVNMIDSVPLAEKYDNNASVSKTETVGWIPCSERLPEPGKRYLVSGVWKDKDFEKHSVYDAVYGTDRIWHTYEYKPTMYEVIAWQPLPEPYKPEGE